MFLIAQVRNQSGSRRSRALSRRFKIEEVEIVVVEDEHKMARALRDGLEAEGHSVRIAHTGEEGFYLLYAHSFDLVILDIMLPGHDGFEILSTLRRRAVLSP